MPAAKPRLSDDLDEAASELDDNAEWTTVVATGDYVGQQAVGLDVRDVLVRGGRWSGVILEHFLGTEVRFENCDLAGFVLRDESVLQRVSEAPALEQRHQRRAARTGGVADGAGLQDCRAQGRLAAGVGPRRAGPHGDGDAGIGDGPDAAGPQPAIGVEPGDRVAGQHDGVEDLAAAHPPGGIHAADRFDPGLRSAGPRMGLGQVGEQMPRGHGGDEGQCGAHALAGGRGWRAILRASHPPC